MSIASFDRVIAVVIRSELVAGAVTFLVAAPLHLGVHIAAGVAEPRILPAAVVESLCGVCLAVAATAVMGRATWAWTAAVTAHVASMAGVALGIAALAVGAAPTTELNVVYHRVILGVLVAGLVLLLSTRGRRALRGRDEGRAGRYRDAA
jgi:hypothetical protein